MNSPIRTTVRVAEGGRIVIPAVVRQRLGIQVGMKLILTVESDHAVLISAPAARRSARERMRKYMAPGVNLSGELMAERKAEAGRG